MIKWKPMLACGALLISGSALAQTTYTSYVFASVTGVEYVQNGNPVSLTGTLVNGSSTTLEMSTSNPYPVGCVNAIATMMSTSGAYRLTITYASSVPPLGGPPITSYYSCRLDVVPPAS
jgi:hypothetical protein